MSTLLVYGHHLLAYRLGSQYVAMCRDDRLHVSAGGRDTIDYRLSLSHDSPVPVRRIVNVSLSYNRPKTSRTVSLFINTGQIDDSQC